VSAKGEIFEPPGLPPVYDYEWYPQQVGHIFSRQSPESNSSQECLSHGWLTQDIYRFIHIADTALLPTSEVLEKEALDAARAWFKSIGKSFWTVCPPDAPRDQVRAAISAMSQEDGKFLGFLDRIHESQWRSLRHLRSLALHSSLTVS
jgi:hypothetical protein